MVKIIIPLLLLSATIGCQKETFNDGALTNPVPIISEIGGQGTYTYGYVGIGQPTLFSDEDGNQHSMAYKFEVFTDTKYNVGDNVKGKLCHCDSLVTKEEVIIKH
jgi:hypothetical protein